MKFEETTLDMNGAVWSPAALDIAIEMFRRHDQLCIKGLAGDDRGYLFVSEDALRYWSGEMLDETLSLH